MDDLEQRVMKVSVAVQALASRLTALYGVGGGEVKPQLEALQNALGELLWKEQPAEGTPAPAFEPVPAPDTAAAVVAEVVPTSDLSASTENA